MSNQPFPESDAPDDQPQDESAETASQAHQEASEEGREGTQEEVMKEGGEGTREGAAEEGGEGKERDILSKWISSISAFVALGTLIWSVGTYGMNARREFEKPYYEKQMTLYFEISRVASTLATSHSEEERTKAYNRFLVLYWGEAYLVNNFEVERSMTHFYTQLVSSKDSVDRDDIEELQHLSYQLTRALRKSLSDTWPVPKGNLRPETPKLEKPIHQDLGGAG